MAAPFMILKPIIFQNCREYAGQGSCHFLDSGNLRAEEPVAVLRLCREPPPSVLHAVPFCVCGFIRFRVLYGDVCYKVHTLFIKTEHHLEMRIELSIGSHICKPF
jgi:hypothetical protein